ncbi:uncharacterized protein [Nicotiana tomentosiformis]|uniref:uncharacterized protein n=1 Tax=Nicotiana tomentosiformis TaxID=4098 RepID=UPI00388C7C5B
MDRFLTKPKNGEPSSSTTRPCVSSQIAPEVQWVTNPSLHSNVDKVLDLKSFEPDPKERMPISDYRPNIRDENELESHENAGDAFTKDGFRGWNKGVERFKAHVSEVNSIHHKCFNKMLDLKNQRQSIQSSFDKQSEKVKSDYRMRLNASIDVARFLLRSGFLFRGHDESEESEYKYGFLELLEWHGDQHPDMGRVILRHAPQNDMIICPTIQKEIVEACAKETTKVIIEDLDGDYFAILVDKSKDVSHGEQMALILQYVNKSGMVIERFLGIVHVSDTSSSSLQKAIYSLLLDHSLSKSKIRGQGYDGANMQGKINGLKSLILQNTPSAYCIHRFAHQLQLALVALSKKHLDVDNFFYVVTNVLNTIGSSFKCMESLQQHQADKLEELLKFGEVFTGQDQDIVNAMGMFDLAKKKLQMMRETDGTLFIDLEFQELNDRFDVVTTDLLLGMANLSPVDSFDYFDKDKIMKLEEYYPSEFGDNKHRELGFQLDSFIVYAQKYDSRFLNLKGIKNFARVMIETKLDLTWTLIYFLVKLTLLIPVATASVERAFSSMKCIKDDLRNRMDNDF